MRYLLPLLAFFLILGGCGTTTDRQTKTVEVEEWRTPPMQVETPVGTIVLPATQVIHQRTQEEVEQTRKVIDMPQIPVGAIMQAASATPWGAIVSGVLGMGVAAFAGKKAIEARANARQRNELIDGIEEAKAKIPPEHWQTLTTELEKQQNADTKAIVQQRTA